VVSDQWSAIIFGEENQFKAIREFVAISGQMSVFSSEITFDYWEFALSNEQCYNENFTLLNVLANLFLLYPIDIKRILSC